MRLLKAATFDNGDDDNIIALSTITHIEQENIFLIALWEYVQIVNTFYDFFTG